MIFHTENNGALRSPIGVSLFTLQARELAEFRWPRRAVVI